MVKKGQTSFKNRPVRTWEVFKSMFGNFFTIMHERLNDLSNADVVYLGSLSFHSIYCQLIL